MALKRISKGDDITDAFNAFKDELQKIEDEALASSLSKELKTLQKSVDKLNFKAERAAKDKEMISSLLKKTSDDLNASLAAEKKFLASISHEIRTPLNAINGFIELLRRTSLNTKQREFVSNIYVSSDHLLSLINDVLDVSKIEAGQMELTESEVDLEALLMETVMLTSVRAKEGVELIVDIPELDFLVDIDALRLKQIFVNLLGNASKFTTKGFIRLSLDEMVERSEEKMWMRFCVEDTGIGISKERVEKLFSAFAQAHTSDHGGTGLGLYLSKSISSVMGGTIYVESVEDVGSKFFVELVMHKGVQRSEQYDFDGLNILMIEGDENFCKKLESKFAQANTNLTVLHKENTIHEISKLVFENEYDLLLLDLDLLGKSAKALAELVASIYPHLLIVGTMQHDEVLDYSTNITILQKPFPFHMLAKLINESDATKAESLSSDFSHLKILVVEDVEMNVMLVREMFKTFFHATFKHAKNGEVGVDMVKNSQYDIIFMDIQMPIMDGITATKEIRKFDNSTPILQ
jgi:signal transduction histidine kinase/DNA-binding response OmpR family regulator